MSKVESVLILGASSDIGRAIAERYLDGGCSVVGTYRNESTVLDLRGRPKAHLIECDVTSKASIHHAALAYSKLDRPWDLFVSGVGTLEPIGGFFETNFDAWEQAIEINALAQLRFLHEVYKLRRVTDVSHVAFFAGGGTNNAFTNFSAYVVSKIVLIKMCELLDDEYPNLNVFILGPGWVRTKIHKQVIENKSTAGDSFFQTVQFLNSSKNGTSYQDIFDCLQWCVEKGRTIAGGRNFSVVHDPWKEEGNSLARQLTEDFNKFKLRRFGNQQ